MILMIDNYDSFTYNLVQYLGELRATGKSCAQRSDWCAGNRSDCNPNTLCCLPVPAHRMKPGVSLEVVKQFAGKIPILGVCLGHQTIGQAFGGKIVQGKRYYAW